MCNLVFKFNLNDSMNSGQRLFLLDAYALIFRGYYAFIKNPRINSKGMDTSAIMGFTNSLLDVIKREKPDYLAVCFDKGGSHTRTELFNEYKANREETPEPISLAIPYIEKLLNAMLMYFSGQPSRWISESNRMVNHRSSLAFPRQRRLKLRI